MELLSQSAVAVKSTTGALTAAGVWTGVIIASLALAGYVVKVAPSWRKIGVEERQDDLERLGSRIAKLEGDVATANTSAHNAEMSMVTLVAALQLVMGEIEKLDPGNRVLVQAREMVAAARTGDFGMHQAITRLAMVAGVGER